MAQNLRRHQRARFRVIIASSRPSPGQLDGSLPSAGASSVLDADGGIIDRRGVVGCCLPSLDGALGPLIGQRTQELHDEKAPGVSLQPYSIALRRRCRVESARDAYNNQQTEGRDNIHRFGAILCVCWQPILFECMGRCLHRGWTYNLQWNATQTTL